MTGSTKIEWADSTFNPWEGCTKVGPGCDHCYAEARNARFAGGTAANWGPGAPRRLTSAANWKLPRAWNAQPFAECMACRWRGESRRANLAVNPPGFHPPVSTALLCPQGCGPLLKRVRRRVFCASLADVFDNEVDLAWRADLFALIASTPNLDWLLLTKRIGNAWPMIAQACCSLSERTRDPIPAWPWPNVWLGATVVNQAEADRDMPKLMATPARVRFLSIEPMLGPIDLQEHLWYPADDDATPPDEKLSVDWIIAGGESGRGARPTHPDWFRSLRDQCMAAGVPFLFKQWGEWATCPFGSDPKPDIAINGDGATCSSNEPGAVVSGPMAGMRHVGKSAAGRLLDGIEHNGFPEVRP